MAGRAAEARRRRRPRTPVHHHSPGTSKLNKIKHHPFCQITENCPGHPLTYHVAAVEVIDATTTKSRGRTLRGLRMSVQTFFAATPRRDVRTGGTISLVGEEAAGRLSLPVTAIPFAKGFSTMAR
jgi:hypothetical protein